MTKATQVEGFQTKCKEHTILFLLFDTTCFDYLTPPPCCSHIPNFIFPPSHPPQCGCSSGIVGLTVCVCCEVTLLQLPTAVKAQLDTSLRLQVKVRSSLLPQHIYCKTHLLQPAGDPAPQGSQHVYYCFGSIGEDWWEYLLGVSKGLILVRGNSSLEICSF